MQICMQEYFSIGQYVLVGCFYLYETYPCIPKHMFSLVEPTAYSQAVLHQYKRLLKLASAHLIDNNPCAMSIGILLMKISQFRHYLMSVYRGKSSNWFWSAVKNLIWMPCRACLLGRC
ncbi:hypothetical protein PR048_020268 [Dryococelus australis]|uniref:Uncharacterized protein n=1 Tax=Dryococelus australis TaxID=614101 RepID=A0ABQ9H5T7_9NEOP|nr:hypothetical protein PR048_020268 [Dryococelus australis]